MSEQQLVEPLPYVKFSELEFFTDEHRIAARELFKSIEATNISIMEDEEKAYIMMDEIGKQAAMMIVGEYMLRQYEIQKAMKVTFWTLTGINFSSILMDLTDDEKKDLYTYHLV